MSIVENAESDWKELPHTICKQCGSEILKRDVEKHKEICKVFVKVSKTKP